MRAIRSSAASTSSIYVLGADHGGYVKRLKAVAKAIAGEGMAMSVPLMPAREALSRWRTGAHVETGRRIHHAARSGG